MNIPDFGALMKTVQGMVGNVSPQEMFEQAKLTVLATIRENPPPSYFAQMERSKFSREQAEALWRFCYSQGALVDVDMSTVIAAGKAAS